MRTVVAAALVSLVTSWAQAQDRMLDPLEKMFVLYAGHVGTLSMCAEGPEIAGIEREAKNLAEFKHPGWMARADGSRSAYEERLMRLGRSEYRSASAARRCPSGIEVGTARQLVRHAESSLAHFTSEE